MKIALFHTSFKSVGGAEILALAQARHLRAAGDALDLLTFAFDRGRWGEALGDMGLHLVKKGTWVDFLVAWSRTHKLERRGQRAQALLRALDPDLVFSHNPVCCGMLAGSDLRGRKVWYCHEPPRGLYPRETDRCLVAAREGGLYPTASPGFREIEARWNRSTRETRRRIRFDQAGARAMDRIIANSAFCRDNAARIYGRTDIDVVYPMVDFPSEVPPRQGLDRSGLKVLAQSRLEAAKNIDTVLRGFAAAAPRLGADPCLHVVGEGRERAHLEALALELGVRDRVRFHGFLGTPALREVQRACDVFALVPWDEPFGMVFPESAARGLLLVGPDHGGPREILEDGRYGWTAPAHAPEALGATLEAVWALSDGEADRRRAEADRACRARFAPEVIGPALRSLLVD